MPNYYGLNVDDSYLSILDNKLHGDSDKRL